MPQSRSIGEILRDAEAGRLDMVFAENREPYDMIGAAERLFDLLDERKIDYVLVGGMAMLQYVDGRNTRDVDLIIDPKDLAKLPGIAISSSDKEFGRGDFSGVQVDLLFTANKLFRLVESSYTTTATFAGRSIRCATREGMLLLKFFALPSLYRQGDTARAAIYEADVAGLLSTAELNVEDAFKQLAPHLPPTDIAELRKIVAQLKSRESAFSPSKIQSPKSKMD